MRGQTTSRRRPRPAAVSARASSAGLCAAWRCVAIAAAALASVPAAALGTQAGNDIDNVASAIERPDVTARTVVARRLQHALGSHAARRCSGGLE